MPSDIHQQRRKEKSMNGVDVGIIGSHGKSRNEFGAMVEHKNGSHNKKRLVDPWMGGGAVDADIEEQRDDDQNMEEREDKVFVHFYPCTRKSHDPLRLLRLL